MYLSCAFNKKDMWHSAIILKTESPSGRVSPRLPCISPMPQFLRPLLSLWIFLHMSPFPEFNIQSGTMRETEFFFFFSQCGPFCLFIYSWLSWVFVVAHRRLSRCNVRPSRCGGVSCCGAQPRGWRLQGLCTRASLLHGSGNPPGPGIKLVSPASAGGFSPTVPPGEFDVDHV